METKELATSKENKVKLQFQIGDLLPIGITLVVLGIGISYGLNVMENVQSDQTADSAAYNATGQAISGVAKLPEQMGLIVTVIVAAIIIGILVRYLMVRYT